MTNEKSELATVAGGCFWCLDAVYRDLRGVERVTSGYTGGRRPNPTYEQVCTGVTGHAEAVEVAFDPAAISYRDILAVFFAIHDPTTLNRQGADVGTQYRSAIFFHSPEQEAQAKAVVAELTPVFDDPIVTEIVPQRRSSRRRAITRTTIARIPVRATVAWSSHPRWRSSARAPSHDCGRRRPRRRTSRMSP
jgi:peptide-methionine (S)-S-oxide reductase